MANPLPNEDELFKRIKDEKIGIHPVIWELLSHHISNDLTLIALPLQIMLDPVYPKIITSEKAKAMLDHAMMIKDFMAKLKRATGKDAKF